MRLSKRLLIPVIATITLVAYLVTSTDSVQAQENILGDVAINSIVLEGSYNAYSNNPVQYFGDVAITPSAAGNRVTKVVLRHKVTKAEIKVLPNSSGNNYTLGNISGQEVLLTGQAEQQDAVFYWFRDPTNKKVWMYDLNGVRHYFQNSGIYPGPQSNADYIQKPIGSSFPTSAEFSTAPKVSNGNVGTTIKAGDLPTYLDGDGLSFPVDRLTSLVPTYKPSSSVPNGYITSSDILSYETVPPIDFSSRILNYKFTASYTIEPFTSDPKTDGSLVNAYRSRWDVDLTSKVYKYPQMEIVFYEGPDNGDSAPPSTTTSTATPAPTSTPSGPEVITGDFTIEKPQIIYRESNTFTPVNVTVSGGSGCTFKSSMWQVTQGSSEDHWYGTKAPWVQSFSGPPYPGNIVLGTVEVTLTVETTCGTTKVFGPKSFELIDDPANPNDPPVFEGAWFQGGNSFGYPPITQAMLGDYVDLGIVHDFTQDPETPYDPDGDEIIYTWDFKGSSDPWIRAIGEKFGDWNHDEHYKLIKADVLGIHTVKVTGADARGKSGGTIDVTIEVMDPNAPPIPVITLPPKVVEGRTFSPDINGINSYSPIKSRTITNYIWTGKQAMYPTAGTYPIILSVIDSAGIQSEYPDVKDLIVQPDLPPVPQLTNPGIGIRNSPIYFKDTSYSPDGDPIATHTTELAYDSDNDGSFADEIYTPVSLDGSGNFSYTASKVGKYNIRIYVKEGLGYQKEASGNFGFEVVNVAPEVDFAAFGVQPKPADIKTIAPTANDLITSSSWTASTISNSNALKLYEYDAGDGALKAYGMLNVQPYKSITSTNVKTDYVKIFTSYCGECGNTGSNYTYEPNFIHKWRLDKRFWYYGNDYSGYFFYNEENPAVKRDTQFVNTYTGDYLGKYNSESNFEYYGPFPRIFIQYGGISLFSKNSDKIWTGSKPMGMGGYDNYSWQEKYYRISDLKAFRSNDYPSFGGMDGFPDYRTDSKSVYASSEPTVPFPADIPKDPDFQDGVLMDNHVSAPYNINAPFQSQFDKDFSGNKYQNICIQNIYDPIYSDCRLEKYNPSGGLIWTFNPPKDSGMSSNYEQPYPVLNISSNNSKALVSYTLNNQVKIAVLDNNTGTVMLDLMKAFNGYRYSPTTTLGKNVDVYLGTYKNKVAYIKQTISGDVGTWELMFYNMLTGTTTNAGVIKSYSSYMDVDEDSDAEYYVFAPEAKATVSSDGKLVLANYLSNVLVYDMNTYAKEADILVAGDSENGYLSTYERRHNISGINLTLDGEVKIAYLTYHSGDSSFYRYILTISSDPSQNANDFSYGFISNQSESLADGDVSTKVKFTLNTYSDTSTAGVGFRAADHRNMYRAELTPTSVRLVKIVNGVSTVLGSRSYVNTLGTYVELKAKVRGNHITVFVAGVPLIDAYDNTFASGTFGVYSEVPYVYLKDFKGLVYSSNSSTVPNVAIVNTPITYSTRYSDPENDPAIDAKAKWIFTNLQPNKFLDAGDGASDPVGSNSYNGVTVQTAYPSLSKVGVYKVDFQVPDDPAPAGYKHPSTIFAGYQKYSDLASHNITVHRRPINDFSVTVNGDGTLLYTERGYDPDRWLSSTNYSTEATGINYQTTRGILQRNYSYTTPSGQTFSGKLTRPQESGTYTIREAVADEYGAWSDWAEQTVSVALIPPNNPPSVALTFPAGTFSNPSYVTSLTPTVTWNQWDPDAGTVFGAVRIVVKDEWGNVVIDRTVQQNTPAGVGSWQLDTALLAGAKYQVQVMVSDDGGAWSPWSNIGWLITNRPPTAYMSYPFGTQAEPTIVGTLRPTFQWSQTDPDPGTVFSAFQLQVTNEANNIMILDSGPQWQNTSSTSGSWTPVTDLPAGQKLQVWVRVFDGIEWSSYSPKSWFYINRPPVADFDWQPKPVWEGDRVRLYSLSVDPDGTPLAFDWTIQHPGGAITRHDAEEWNGVFGKPGIYQVRLAVTDGLASAEVTKTVEALPLTIQADVRHTAEWLQLHERLGHQTVEPPKDFYSGEKMLVHIRSAPAPVSEADAWLEGTNLNGEEIRLESELNAAAGDPSWWSGELFDERLVSLTERLPDGLQIVHFRLLYANGVEKRTEIPIRIIGSVHEAVQVHRVQ